MHLNIGHKIIIKFFRVLAAYQKILNLKPFRIKNAGEAFLYNFFY